jgi:hypothetical protein
MHPPIHALFILLPELFLTKTGSHDFCYIPPPPSTPLSVLRSLNTNITYQYKLVLPLMQKKELTSEPQYIHMINTTIVKTHVNGTQQVTIHELRTHNHLINIPVPDSISLMLVDSC